MSNQSPSHIKYKLANPTIAVVVPLALKNSIGEIARKHKMTKSTLVRDFFEDLAGYQAMVMGKCNATILSDRKYYEKEIKRLKEMVRG